MGGLDKAMNLSKAMILAITAAISSRTTNKASVTSLLPGLSTLVMFKAEVKAAEAPERVEWGKRDLRDAEMRSVSEGAAARIASTSDLLL